MAKKKTNGRPNEPGRYEHVISHLFSEKYQAGDKEVNFSRDDINETAKELGIGNIGDIVYYYRYRSDLPAVIVNTALDGLEWIIRGRGDGRYSFVLVPPVDLKPNVSRRAIKVPEATPSIVTRYALTDEQAILTLVRYNRLIDLLTGAICYTLQNHLRAKVPQIGQVETDELYVGLDNWGAQYVFPVQAKGKTGRLGRMQIEQDIALCRIKYADLICRPIAVVYYNDSKRIVLFELIEGDNDEINVVAERHYQLVVPDKIEAADLELYRRMSLTHTPISD